jgi:flagellar hook-associated protein 2
MADLSLSGLASGFDWKSVVDQLTQIARTPEQRLRIDQNKILQRNNAYGSISTQMQVVKNHLDDLNDPTLFGARTAQVGDSTIASATADSDTALGTYTFNFTQLATAAARQGTSNAGAALNSSNDVSGLVLSNAAFASPITAGTITVNNKQITIDTSDTLKGVFDKISAATGGSVTGAYDASTDKITLSSASTITLGSATDTSNFLNAAQLGNNGTGTVTSRNTLGVVKQSGALNAANLTTAITDGGSGAGEFKINGVSISFSASSDSVSDVLKRINDSAAGVTATYDSVNDRFTLTNKTTGDIGIAIEDVTGNFLPATGISGGTLNRGKDLLYTINGGGQLVSHSNIITSDSSGLTGLSVTALKEGSSTTITVGADTTKMKKAITDFISEYNRAQSLIDSTTASSTDANGKVTAGLLAGESDAYSMASGLRSHLSGGGTGPIKFLADLGIDGSGTDNTLTLSDASKLDDALANNLSAVKDFFTNSTTGLATKLASYVDKITDTDTGLLKTKQDNLTKQSTTIDTQVSSMEKMVLANKDRLTAGFVAMETAQAKVNQQLQFLQKRFA